ncbi:MAG TPA: (E)-4-hydroxy-3-methylbut-2-enyl-diphosphate synthase [Ferruginibacter sp.]|nr:(E)-4-hydroxy-3-methylbut-2-enyl-diphosphate synthase [Ferruginibacter sp.]HRO17977.1 (E)-4-hydroxy-3-methylbut-2-enyl-diphosphate synthase [Ferruginibacter sp.]HRQ21436.1 (E)-4-hydroxy-3-methylbut-2-enyl-diphosphate synthase [Ferruginibacter sp.]
MQLYCSSTQQYKRLPTRPVKVGNLWIGGTHPLRVQTMTTTDTMDTEATVEQVIRCADAGAELVRITAPSKKEAENLRAIKEALLKRGYTLPLVADIHFTPNAAEIAAGIIEKVRINPGNYVDKKKFEQIEYTDAAYADELKRIAERFSPLVELCKKHGTAMRIGTNHGSLSDRIMSRYGDTPRGMVESAMEFLRIARALDYHQIILSMKSSNPLVMVQAYRLLVQQMLEEFGECYPLHLGVTEAGDGEDGRIKSAIGIGTLLEDGIGDTIRVSLTEDPEFEIPVCKDLVKKYNDASSLVEATYLPNERLWYNPFEYKRRVTQSVTNIGGANVPVVFADFMQLPEISREALSAIGYRYQAETDKWHIGDAAADIIYTHKKTIPFELPGTVKAVCDASVWSPALNNHYPLYTAEEYAAENVTDGLHFVTCDVTGEYSEVLERVAKHSQAVLCIYATGMNSMQKVRSCINTMIGMRIHNPVILAVESHHTTIDEQLIHFSVQAGALLLEGMGDGIWLMNDPSKMLNRQVSGRTYLPIENNHQFLNQTSFSILQATRTRISKTEYISCPSCGRTLFDLQETTAKIRRVTHHLKGLKIAIMGCIVNGPGEMADADFGYVGSGPGKITLYKGKEVVKRNINSDVAVNELINILKENNVWIEPAATVGS